ncbi:MULTISPECIES: hypothetical protein [unclassified Frondihabitans]|uniref:hypothetical protein n=1 Tax=unclassified Frondihabitans TaxID=2626248 RepID=UPI000F507494|nr:MULTISPECIES: hypothetical protein [unclassified Frondihabitans]RPE78962.1 hypothetical protein EDF37_1650 [Frondihabitans sp. PhB153]RPF09243.1 hypothetical protein EDF39_1652 [Frondihabitans sp. PhB161]
MSLGQIIALVLGSTAVAAVLSAVITGLFNMLNGNKVERNRLAILDQQRLTENSNLLSKLAATAHGRPADGRDGAGTTEQIVAVEMITALGSAYEPLRRAAYSMLTNIPIDLSVDSTNAEGLQRIRGAASHGAKSLEALPDFDPEGV